jgi:pimeloyl-ACP methyl ester carboxylesterase
MIPSLRTPDERFDNLPGYTFKPNYASSLDGYEGLRVHYLDEGNPAAEHTFLCLHGQPSWSYLYRKMIPIFTDAGHRVIAPDLLGFGRSDKPLDEDVYSFHFHRNMLMALINELDLKNITLVCQDWGGILGLTIPPVMQPRFSRLLVMNTAIPIGESLGEGFAQWRAFNRTQKDLNIGRLFQRATPSMSDEEAAAYDAPFPDASYKAGVRKFPDLVMTDPDMEGVAEAKQAREWWGSTWHGASFMAIGMADPVLGEPIMRELQQTINGCSEPLEIEDGGHFVQESGDLIAQRALQYFDEQGA